MKEKRRGFYHPGARVRAELIRRDIRQHSAHGICVVTSFALEVAAPPQLGHDDCFPFVLLRRGVVRGENDAPKITYRVDGQLQSYRDDTLNEALPFGPPPSSRGYKPKRAI